MPLSVQRNSFNRARAMRHPFRITVGSHQFRSSRVRQTHRHNSRCAMFCGCVPDLHPGALCCLSFTLSSACRRFCAKIPHPHRPKICTEQPTCFIYSILRVWSILKYTQTHTQCMLQTQINIISVQQICARPRAPQNPASASGRTPRATESHPHPPKTSCGHVSF